jgi:FAD/FMN-containing dehydrogenase/Fe-S oxidoreductase
VTETVPPAQLAAELRRVGITADVTTRRRAEYSSDASNYRVVPAAVAFPHDAAEVAAVLGVCRRLGVPLTVRGAGTSIAGNAVGSGVVLDFSRHFNRVHAVDPQARTATTDPGAILDSITLAASRHGLRFGPDPSTHARATIGGALGNNACGSRALAYGRSSDNVVSLDLLSADGQRFSTDAVPARLNEAITSIVASRLAVIRTEFGRFGRQISGYSMEWLLPENGARLAPFLVGTEGTLAVIVGATVRLVHAPVASALAVLGYPDLASAAEAVPALLPHRPVALEGIDARLVGVVRARRGPAATPELPKGAGWLLVETAGATPSDARSAAGKLIADAGCVDSAILTGWAASALWRIREDGAGLGGRTPAGQPAWPGWEDAAVPPEQLADYLREFDRLLFEHGLQAVVYGHFGDGCVHARIDLPLRRDVAAFRAFLGDAAVLVASYGGSMSGEHGDGRARGELLSVMYSPAAIDTFAAVKHAFDPSDLLNPGVIVRPAPLDAQLRLPRARPLSGLGFAYPHDNADLTEAVHRCVGVGKCRADLTTSGGVMCPSYLATKDEKDSTRGRARVLQEMANGSLVRDGWRAPELRESLDLCLSCKGCSVDCPAGVDMATYKAEVLYQRYRRRPRPPAHYSLGWLPRWAKLAAHAPGLANGMLRHRLPAAAAKRIAGIDRRRPLPRFAADGFRRWIADHTPASGPPVMLWVDTFTEHFSPQVGIAAVRVLEQAGYSVRVPQRPACCGLTWISTGQLNAARRQLRRSLDALAPALHDGMPIVGLEPSCTAVFRADALELLPGDARAASVRDRIRTLAELLADTDGWSPPRLDGLRAVAQPHCHQHAVLGWGPDAALLTQAGADVHAVGGCCGLAGNFGMERGHYDVSAAIAESALLPAVRQYPGALVLADGFSCRIQLDQLAARRGWHLAEVLATALTRGELQP